MVIVKLKWKKKLHKSSLELTWRRFERSKNNGNEKERIGNRRKIEFSGR